MKQGDKGDNDVVPALLLETSRKILRQNGHPSLRITRMTASFSVHKLCDFTLLVAGNGPTKLMFCKSNPFKFTTGHEMKNVDTVVNLQLRIIRQSVSFSKRDISHGHFCANVIVA
jgi:hypothetical protein